MSRISCFAVLTIALLFAGTARAQEGEVSLGQVAREARQAKTPENPTSNGQPVIDNDNFAAVLDEAEAARLTGKPVFSIDPSGNAFRMTSPDGTCSLSFDAKATALISSSFVSTDLPQDELPKLEGHALIHDDLVEVSVHNGTPWELREMVIGITVLQKPVQIDLIAAEPKMVSDPSWTGKLPDSTAIYHLRGSIGANSTGTLSAVLKADSNISIGGNADWHWALVSARGVPPPASPRTHQGLTPYPGEASINPAQSLSGGPAATIPATNLSPASALPAH
jgi:hypothetical protein